MNPHPVIRESGHRTAFHVQPLAPMDAQIPVGTYQPLIERLAAMRRELGIGVIAGFTSISRGDGVTFIVESLAWELTKQTGEQILLTTPDGLISAATARFGDPGGVSHALYPVRRLRSIEPAARHWEAAPPHEFEGLRRRFGFVLVDCPPICESRGSGLIVRSRQAASRYRPGPEKDSSTLSVCRACDGVVLVVSAGTTNRSDIQYAQSALQVASANLIGLVLNKRANALPGFLAKWME